jgi:hypothetical protein
VGLILGGQKARLVLPHPPPLVAHAHGA